MDKATASPVNLSVDFDEMQKVRDINESAIRRTSFSKNVDKTAEDVVACEVRIKWFLYFFKLIGLFFCSIRNGRLCRMSSTRIYSIPVVWLFFHIATAIVLFISRHLFREVESLATVILYIRLEIEAYFALYKQDWYIEIFENLYKFDVGIAKFGFKRTKEISNSVWLTAFIFAAFNIIFWIFYYVPGASPSWTIYFKVVSLVMKIESMASDIKITLLLSLLRERFNFLHEMVLPHICWFGKLYEDKTVTIHDFKYLHYFLTESVHRINQLYGAYFLVFCIEVMSTSMIILSLILNTNDVMKVFTVNVYVVLSLLIVCWNSHLILKVMKAMSKQIVRANTSTCGPSRTQERIELTVYMLHNTVPLNALEFFTMDLQLVFFVGGVAAAYLFFLI